MWRCSCCRKRFEDHNAGIDHARTYHSRDYTACEYVPRHRPRAAGLSSLLTPVRAMLALVGPGH